MFERTCGRLKDRCTARCSVSRPFSAKGQSVQAHPAPQTTRVITHARYWTPQLPGGDDVILDGIPGPALRAFPE